MIPEPQRTYVLELLHALGSVANDFVVAGAQAMKFMLERARATRDIDFVLDVVRLRGEPLVLAAELERLGYKVVEGSRNFQFQKPIPNSFETMRIEFMAPEEFKREKDFRVEVQDGVHARALAGGSIAIREVEERTISGRLPDGTQVTVTIKVTQPHTLVMLKLLAMDDRYRNIRGAKEERHDREEARIHSSDIVAIISGQVDTATFKENFDKQFGEDEDLTARAAEILKQYFKSNVSPGLLLYEEFLAANQPTGADVRREIKEEVVRAHALISKVFGLG